MSGLACVCARVRLRTRAHVCVCVCVCCDWLKVHLCYSPVTEFPSLLKLNGIPLWVYTTFCLSVHQLMDIRLFPHFGYCEQCYYKHYCTNFCLNTCFQVWGIYLRVKLLGHMVILHLLGSLSHLSSLISPIS